MSLQNICRRVSCWYCSEKYFSFKYFSKYQICFFLEDFIIFVRLLLAAVSIMMSGLNKGGYV